MTDIVWNMFNKETIEVRGDEKTVLCVLCENVVQFNTISDLKKHLIKKHSNYMNVLDMNSSQPRARYSVLWKHFTRTECKYFAQCNHCDNIFSYKTTIANLKKHLDRSHPEIEVKIDVPESDIGTTKYEADTESENNEEAPAEQTHEEEEDDADVWSYFEKIPSNRARCVLCKETFARHTPYLSKHINDKHRKTAMDLPSDSDEDQENCYTEVVYLEEDPMPLEATPPKKSIEPPTKLTKKKPELSKRSYSGSQFEHEYAKKVKYDREPKRNEMDEEIENFGRYVTGILKKMPKDVCTQLQMDIVNLIMTAKLNKMAPPPPPPPAETVNVSLISEAIQDGVAVTPGNVMDTTTPSNVTEASHDNDILQSLVIGLEKES